jgi:ABC-2 type transport system ATP-binding protein
MRRSGIKENINKAVVVSGLVKNFEVLEKGARNIDRIKSLLKPKKKVVTALKGISFSIGKGELVGFIGANGAGKTTTMKILSGLLYPTAGFVQVLGFNPWDRKREFLKRISLVMGQKNQLWWDLPAIDTLELNRAIYEIPHLTFKKVLDELVEILDVKDLLTTPVRKLSLGQRMRFELIAALIHQPEVLFLDEPTIGLDVVGQQAIRDFIYQYNRKFSATVMLTSHNMSDLVDLTKRVIVIDKGEIVFDGKLTDLITNYAKEKIIKIYFSGDVNIGSLEKICKIRRYAYPEAVISVDRSLAAFTAAELLQNFPVADITIEEEGIESIVRRVFRGEAVNG